MIVRTLDELKSIASTGEGFNGYVQYPNKVKSYVKIEYDKGLFYLNQYNDIEEVLTEEELKYRFVYSALINGALHSNQRVKSDNVLKDYYFTDNQIDRILEIVRKEDSILADEIEDMIVNHDENE